MTVDVFGVVQLVFLTIIILLISFQMVKRNAKPLKWLVITFSFAWIRALLSLIMNPDADKWDVEGEFQLFFLVLTMVGLYTFLEYTLNDKPLVRRAIIIYGLTGVYIGFYIIALSTNATNNGVDWPFASEIPFWQLPVDLIQVIVYLFGLYTFQKMVRHSDQAEARKLSLFLSFAFLLMLFSGIMELTEYSTGKEFSQTLTTLPAFIILLIVYTYRPYFSYSSPVGVYRLLVIHEHGLTIIEDNFTEKYGGEEMSGSLLGGVTTSINSLFREVTQSQGSLEKIITSTSTFLTVHIGQVFVVMEVERSTRILNTALTNFANDFVTKYQNDLQKFSGEITVFNDYKDILRGYFPFLSLS